MVIMLSREGQMSLKRLDTLCQHGYISAPDAGELRSYVWFTMLVHNHTDVYPVPPRSQEINEDWMMNKPRCHLLRLYWLHLAGKDVVGTQECMKLQQQVICNIHKGVMMHRCNVCSFMVPCYDMCNEEVCMYCRDRHDFRLCYDRNRGHYMLPPSTTRSSGSRSYSMTLGVLA